MRARQEHWQQVYIKRSPQAVSWYQPWPALSLALIQDSGVAVAAPLIDVGGGASCLVDALLDGGFQDLSVLDIAAAALAHARQRLGTRADGVTWHEADVTTWRPTRRYALWHDRAVFHFLTAAEDRAAYVANLHRALVPDGQLILAAFAPGGPEQCSGLPIVQYDGVSLLAALGSGFELLEQRNEAHQTPSGNTQAFAYFRLRRVPDNFM